MGHGTDRDLAMVTELNLNKNKNATHTDTLVAKKRRWNACTDTAGYYLIFEYLVV